MRFSCVLLLVSMLGSPAFAQPDVRDHRAKRPDVRDHRAPGGGPTEAPPTPHEEKIEARAGFVWIAGRWDWREAKWAWVDGHWERERAGKQWRPGRWDHKDTTWTYVEGEWTSGGSAEAVVPPPPPPPITTPPPGAPPVPGHSNRQWKIDRPIVSSYWPVKGKPGTRIKIRGHNFAPDTTVLWGNEPMLGANVKPDEIVVVVPANAASGVLALRGGHGRALSIGAFEVAATFDPEAEARKLEEQRRHDAETAWAGREKALAKDRAARESAAAKLEQERVANREQRRADRVAAIRAKWEQAFLADADTQAELTLHAQRVAQLTRMREVAEISGNSKVGVRIDLAEKREIDRHEQRMQALHDGFGAKGGKP